MNTLLTILLMAALVDFASSHGRLLVPPQRSSMWRAGFPVYANYDDNGLNCGGLSNQFSQNGGQCGICGDPFQGPFPNEAGGKYASGIIGKNFTQGQIMQVTVELTSNHLGYFEFRLCPHNNPNTKVNQTCLDQNLLLVQVQGQWVTKYYPGSKGGYHNVDVKLPGDVTCTQCVFQWKYRAGNNWDCSDEEGCCSGCGPQEHFINCADIAIMPSPSATTVVTSSTPLSTTPLLTTPLPIYVSPTSSSSPASSSPSQSPSTVTSQPTQRPSSTLPSQYPSTSPPTTTSQPTRTSTPSSTSSPSTSPPTTTAPPSSTVSRSTCRGKTGWDHISNWCLANCAIGYCPDAYCTCTDAVDPYDSCVAIGWYVGDHSMDVWCIINCRLNYCPASHCSCPWRR